MGIFIVAGVPGCGKTTVITEALKRLPGFKAITYGSIMTELGVSEGIIKDRDEIRRLSPAKFRALQAKTARKIKKESDNVIVDTHVMLPTPTGYNPGFTIETLTELKAEAIVLIEAGAEDIISRRNADDSRVRGFKFEQDISQHMDVNRAMGCAMALQTNARLFIVENPPGKAAEAGEKIANTIKGFIE